MRTILFYIITIAVTLAICLSITTLFNPMVNGNKRWATYTGTLMEFDIDCSQCCHPSSYFKINTSDGIRSELIGNCNEELEHRVYVGNVYIIRIEPYAEPYAISHNFGEPGSFWAVQIDWIKNSHGDVIYGSEWF